MIRKLASTVLALVSGNGSGGRLEPLGESFVQPYELFELSQDIGKTNNPAQSQPDTLGRLAVKF